MNIFEQSVHPGASSHLRLWHRHISQHHSAHATTLCVISAVHWALSVTLLYPAPCNCYWQGINYWQLILLLHNDNDNNNHNNNNFCSWFWRHSFHSSSVERFYRCWWASSCTMTSQSATLLKASRWGDAPVYCFLISDLFLCICWISHFALWKMWCFLYSWPCWSTSTHSLSVCSAVRKKSFWAIYRCSATRMWRWSASCLLSWGDTFPVVPGKQGCAKSFTIHDVYQNISIFW